MLKNRSFCVIGAGTLGKSIIRGLLRSGKVKPEAICATVGHEASVEAAAAELPVAVGTNNAAAAERADVVILAVKPQKMTAAAGSLRRIDLTGKLIISLAAGVGTAQVEAALGTPTALVRGMPNTPCLLGVGMTAVCGGAHASAEDVALAQAIFAEVGRTVEIDEQLMDGVTALSGSGPAYVFVVIEALAEAGVKLGIARKTATLLAAQTLMGAAHMVLELGAHPALLKDGVTTPAGCTIDGLMELEEGKLRVTLIKAVVKAAERASRLGAGAHCAEALQSDQERS
jgi:pyrroline-5-carboxylate reductase